VTQDDLINLAKQVGGTIMRPYDYGAEPDRMILTFEEIVQFAAALQSKANKQEAAIKQALDFCDYVWRDVSLNDYGIDQLDTTTLALQVALK